MSVLQEELEKSGYMFATVTGVWSRPNYKQIDYNDGDEVEERIGALLAETEDRSVFSAELHQYCNDWTTSYHLGSSRANSVRPFERLLKNATVLEVGAGCGAITRYLGESGANVLALEGAVRRAAIARSRVLELDNVTVVSERFDTFDIDSKFDVVTLIGVLEYAYQFMPGEQPDLSMLQHARKFLKPDGILVLAIENQFGLKYFAGAPEDHASIPMYGVEGRYRKNQPRTYGRIVLKQLLQRAGFATSEFIAAFPDYKHPASMITENGFVQKSFRPDALVAPSVSRDPQMPSKPLFRMELACSGVIKNDLGMDMANSFVVVAGAKERARIDTDILGWHFSTSRLARYCKMACFRQLDERSIVVVNKALLDTGGEREPDALLKWYLPSEVEYVQGISYAETFVEIVSRSGWSLFEIDRFFDTYIDIVLYLENGSDSGEGTGGQLAKPFDRKMNGRFIDCVPQNIMVCPDSDPAYVFIDQEWDVNDEVSLGRLLFRAVYTLSTALSLIAPPEDHKIQAWRDLVRYVLQRYGGKGDDLDYLVQQEEAFQYAIRGSASCELERWLDSPLVRSPEGHQVHARSEEMLQDERAIRIRDTDVLQHQVSEQAVRIKNLEASYAHLLHTWSWRVTAPLRFLFTLGRRFAFNVRQRSSRFAREMKHVLRRLLFLRQLRRLCVRMYHICMKVPGIRHIVFRHYSFIMRRLPFLQRYKQGESTSYEGYQQAERQYRERVQGFYAADWHRFARKPLISVVVPVYNTPIEYLRLCLDSILGQLYEKCELIVVDDASTSSHIKEMLESFAQADSRVHLVFRSTNGHISQATNDGISAAKGEYIAFVDHDDVLTEDALYQVVKRINDNPAVDMLYTDQDKITANGKRYDPFFKPDWSPIYLKGVMYLGHLLVIRTELIRSVGGCDPTYDGVQDYELALRISERTGHVEHIPRICYHWRADRGSIAHSPFAKPNIVKLQRLAVQAHLDRMHLAAEAIPINEFHRIRLVPKPAADSPLVSILICSRDAGDLISRCLDSLFDKTRNPAFEVIVADNGTTDPVALAAFKRHSIRKIEMPDAFHFARFNNVLAQAARGEYLLFLNNDTEVVDKGWLDHLVFYAQQTPIGAVGPLLLYPDRSVQHAGVILGPRGTADHLMRNFPDGIDGYNGSLLCDKEVTAVTAACLMISSKKFHAVGGFTELYRNHYEDLDLCLKLRAADYENVYVGATKLIHHESKTRGARYDYTDRVLLLDQWQDMIDEGDPYYNCNFSPNHFDYTVWDGGIDP